MKSNDLVFEVRPGLVLWFKIVLLYCLVFFTHVLLETKWGWKSLYGGLWQTATLLAFVVLIRWAKGLARDPVEWREAMRKPRNKIIIVPKACFDSGMTVVICLCCFGVFLLLSQVMHLSPLLAIFLATIITTIVCAGVMLLLIRFTRD